MKIFWLLAGGAIGWFARSAREMYMLEKRGAITLLTNKPEELSAEFDKAIKSVPILEKVREKLEAKGIRVARHDVELPEGYKAAPVEAKAVLDEVAGCTDAARDAKLRFFKVPEAAPGV